MTAAEKREQSEVRRQQILATALEIIVERGYSQTRIADIAKRTEISNGLVMYYFPTKVELLIGAIRYAEDGWYEALQTAVADTTSSTELLERTISIYLVGGPTEMLQLPWSLWLDLWSQSTRNEAIADVHHQSDDRWRVALSSIVKSGVASNEFHLVGSMENTVIALAAMFDGLAVNIACQNAPVTAEVAFTIAMRFTSLALGFVWQNNEMVTNNLIGYLAPKSSTV